MPTPILTAARRPVKSYQMPPGWNAPEKWAAPSSPQERIRVTALRHQWTPVDMPDLRAFRQSPTARRAACRAMWSDDAVKAGALQLVYGVSQLDLQAAPANANAPGDKLGADFCRYAITEALPGGLPQLVENIALPALSEGHSLCDPSWPRPGVLVEQEPWRGKRVLASIKSRPPESYELIPDDHANIKAVRYQSDNGVREDDPSTFLIFTNLSLYSSPFGMSDFEAAYNHYLIKCAAMKMRQVFLDRLAGGFLAAKSGNPQDSGLKADLAEARGCGYIVLPLTAELQVLDLAGGTDDKFRNGIEDCNQAIVRALNGAYLHIMEGSNQNVPGNSMVAKSGSELLQWRLAAKISSVLTHQLGPILVNENFVGVGYPKLTLGNLDPGFAKAELENGLLLQQAGAGLDPDEWYRKGGWSPPKDPAKALYGVGRGPSVNGGAGGPNGVAGAVSNGAATVAAQGGAAGTPDVAGPSLR